jgi:hypothetical protein
MAKFNYCHLFCVAVLLLFSLLFFSFFTKQQREGEKERERKRKRERGRKKLELLLLLLNVWKRLKKRFV